MSLKNKQNQNDRWYSILTKSEDEAEISIYNLIGEYGITADAFAKEVKAIKAKTVNVRINSMGGEVFEGLAIHTVLDQLDAKVIVHIDGLAASMASIIAMAGDEIRMAKSSYMMIHNPISWAWGESSELRKTADLLDSMKATIVEMYARKSGNDQSKIHEWMDDETWFTAEDAVEAGFADSITDNEAKPVASIDPRILNKAPDGVRRLVAQSDKYPGPIRNSASREVVLKAANLTEIKMNPTQFKQYAVDNPDSAEVRDVMAKGQKSGQAQGRDEATARLKEIIAACPSRPQFCIDQFLAGQDAVAAKASAEMIDRETAAIKAQLDASAKEVERLKALAGAQGAVSTATASAADAAQKKADDAAVPADPKAKAAWEWDNKKTAWNASTKERYVEVRSRELSGQSVSIGKAA